MVLTEKQGWEHSRRKRSGVALRGERWHRTVGMVLRRVGREGGRKRTEDISVSQSEEYLLEMRKALSHSGYWNLGAQRISNTLISYFLATSLRLDCFLPTPSPHTPPHARKTCLRENHLLKVTHYLLLNCSLVRSGSLSPWVGGSPGWSQILQPRLALNFFLLFLDLPWVLGSRVCATTLEFSCCARTALSGMVSVFILPSLHSSVLLK